MIGMLTGEVNGQKYVRGVLNVDKDDVYFRTMCLPVSLSGLANPLRRIGESMVLHRCGDASDILWYIQRGALYGHVPPNYSATAEAWPSDCRRNPLRGDEVFIDAMTQPRRHSLAAGPSRGRAFSNWWIAPTCQAISSRPWDQVPPRARPLLDARRYLLDTKHRQLHHQRNIRRSVGVWAVTRFRDRDSSRHGRGIVLRTFAESGGHPSPRNRRGVSSARDNSSLGLRCGAAIWPTSSHA